MDEVFGEGGGRGKGSEGEVLVEFWVGRGALEEEIGVLGGLGRCRSSVRCVSSDLGETYDEWGQLHAVVFELADWEAKVGVVRSGCWGRHRGRIRVSGSLTPQVPTRQISGTDWC